MVHQIHVNAKLELPVLSVMDVSRVLQQDFPVSLTLSMISSPRRRASLRAMNVLISACRRPKA